MTYQNYLTDIKIAWVTAGATMSTGLATVIDMIPKDIGTYASILGMILTSVLIVTHWRNGRIEYRLKLLEIDIMHRKEAERQKTLARRREEGELRREDDF